MIEYYYSLVSLSTRERPISPSLATTSSEYEFGVDVSNKKGREKHSCETP